MTGCKSGKRRFNTEEDAQDAMKSIRKHPNEKVPCRTYPCRFCSGYHFTSRPGHAGKVTEIKNEAFKQYLK